MKWKLIFLSLFFFFCNRIIYPCDYYLPCCSSGAKRELGGACVLGGGVILQLMAADSQLYCNHGMTHPEEIALHIALPWASVILTSAINGWVNGLQKSFNLCQAELRISNGFAFLEMSRQGISVQPIWEIKLSYYVFEWVFWTHISQYLMETVLTFITWLGLYCGLYMLWQKGDNDFPCQRWHGRRRESERSEMTTLGVPV